MVYFRRRSEQAKFENGRPDRNSAIALTPAFPTALTSDWFRLRCTGAKQV
jgi:hypothetical protein